MGKGIALAVLKAQREVFASATPSLKISPSGMLAYCLSQGSTNRILSSTVDNKSGYIRDVKVRYRKRAAAGESVTTDDCSVQGESAFYEQSIPSLSKRYKGLWFDMPTIKQFEADALASTGAGKPTIVMMEVMEAIMNEINGLLQDINADLVSALVTGKNLSTGLTTAKTVNFTQNTANLVLASGMTEIMGDALLHEVQPGNLDLIGAGIIAKYMLQQGAKGIDQTGLDTSRLALPGFYYDPAFTSLLAANNFVAVEKNALQFINICYNRANAISGGFGTSEFDTITFPVVDSMGNSLANLEFDIQMKEFDCPSDVTIGDEDPAAKGRGMKVIIGCNFALAQIPATAYKAADRMYQVNGVWKYVATNA